MRSAVVVLREISLLYAHSGLVVSHRARTGGEVPASPPPHVEVNVQNLIFLFCFGWTDGWKYDAEEQRVKTQQSVRARVSSVRLRACVVCLSVRGVVSICACVYYMRARYLDTKKTAPILGRKKKRRKRYPFQLLFRIRHGIPTSILRLLPHFFFLLHGKPNKQTAATTQQSTKGKTCTIHK